MGIKMGRGATVHADSIEGQPEDSVTRCGRSSDMIQGVTDAVTCKSCLKLTDKDDAARSIGRDRPTRTAEATHKVGDRLHFTPGPDRAPHGSVIGECDVTVIEVVDHGAATHLAPRFSYVVRADNGHSQGTDDRELSAATGEPAVRPWIAEIQEGDVWRRVGLYGPWALRSEAEAFARESALMSPGTTYRAYNADDLIEGDTFTAAAPEVQRAAVDLVRAPLLATDTMEAFTAEVSTLAEALTGDSGEDAAVQVRWLVQAERGAGWLTWPDAGPFADRYEAIAMAAGAAVGVPDSQWRVIGEVSGEVIWTGPVPASAGDLGNPAESVVERRTVLTPTSGMAEGRATYTGLHRAFAGVTDGPALFRSGPCGKRKIVVRRGRRH